MDNLVNDTNSKLKEIVADLTAVKEEYEKKAEKNKKEIKIELEKVKKYKEDFFEAKEKIDKMNDDIEGFEEDYQKLVDRFKDDELANILVAANKEISSKIEERKRKIVKDKMAMNELVEKAELSKGKLVKLTAEKKALELCLDKILDAYDYYKNSIEKIISYSDEHRDNLSGDDEDELDEEIINDEIEDQDNIDDEEKFEVEAESVPENDDSEENDSVPENDDSEVEEMEPVITEAEENIENTPDEEDIVSEVQEIETSENKEEKAEEDNHILAINEIPNENYNFNDNLDLENIIDFDDSIEDENEE